MAMWDAEIEITPELVRSLLEQQHPDLATDTPTLEGEGFDNAAYRVGEWLFRFPRRSFGAEALEVENAWLPRLARALPLDVPVPERLGSPTDEYPWPFAGYRLLPGRTADRARLGEEERSALAVPLAKFLRALHEIPVPKGAPGDALGRHEHTRRAPQVIERLRDLDEPALAAPAIERVEALAESPAWDGERVWVHGDLYGRHLIVGEDAALTGIIDWGDLHTGDRALDLSIAWSFLPPCVRSQFVSAYGEIREETWARARFRALHYGPFLMLYGRDVGDPAMVALGRLAIEQALIETP